MQKDKKVNVKERCSTCVFGQYFTGSRIYGTAIYLCKHEEHEQGCAYIRADNAPKCEKWKEL